MLKTELLQHILWMVPLQYEVINIQMATRPDLYLQIATKKSA